MRESVLRQRQFRQAIHAELAARVALHQRRVARLAPERGAGAPPLVMLADGDSWFDYPLAGNELSEWNTDIVAQLETLGARPPLVCNLSHFGDTTTTELSLPRQERLIAALRNPANWPDGKPDAILFSGGGNDVAGDGFVISLDYADCGTTGLDAGRFGARLEAIAASYLDFFELRDRYAPGVPVFGHSYDVPVPNGAHPLGVGPWLQPSLAHCGWTDASDGARIVTEALTRFREMVVGLAAEPSNRFVLVPTQGTLAPAEWANELHPTPAGFRKLALRFVEALRERFPGRI